MPKRISVAAACLLLASGCILPARSFGAYEEKAVTTAKDALSAVESARLATRVAAQRKALSPTITILLGEAEEDASSVQSTLASIQPPDARSRALYEALQPTLDTAVNTLTQLRVAARGGRMTDLAAGEGPLRTVSGELKHFLSEHE